MVHHVEGAVGSDGSAASKVRQEIGKDGVRPFLFAKAISPMFLTCRNLAPHLGHVSNLRGVNSRRLEQDQRPDAIRDSGYGGVCIALGAFRQGASRTVILVHFRNASDPLRTGHIRA